MFKKAFTVNQAHKVSGADRKKLRRALEQSLKLGEQDVEAVLPAKAGELEVAKLPAPSRVQIYLHDGSPIILDTSGKGDFMPTVFALWRCPTLLPQVFLKHPAVSTYVVGGADVMLPGVNVSAAALPEFDKGALLAVCSPGNPMPVAVGVAAMSSNDAIARAAAGGKGKLVETMQVYGDCLWADMGGRAVPNDGFLVNAVVPPGFTSVESTLQDEAGEEDGDVDSAAGGLGGVSLLDDHVSANPRDNWEDAAEASTTGEGQAAATQGTRAQLSSSAGVSSPRRADESTAAGTSSNSGGGDADGGAAAQAASAIAAAAAAAAAAGSAPEDMDELLELSLMQALVKSVKDADLPLNSSVLWATHMLPCRPVGSVLDVKKSKHKKLSKFLAAFAKANPGLISVKEDKASGDMVITTLNRKHQAYLDYRPYKAGAQQQNACAAGPAGSAGAGTANASDELTVEEVWKPGKELRPVFEALGAQHDACYTASEMGEIAFAYVKAAKLDEGSPDPRVIVLDVTLCDALFKGLVKKGELYPTHLAKSEIRECILKLCQAQCRISKGGMQVIKKGSLPSVAISTERRQGNKHVTKVSGLEAFLVDPKQVSGEFQKKFAASTSVVDMPGKNAGLEVLVQGNFPEEIGDYLVKTYNIPKKYIAVKK